MMSGTYNYWLVALSCGIALFTSYTGMSLAERVTDTEGVGRHAWLGGGAIAMGTGIWCMHTIGMLAFRMPITVRYDVPTVAISLLLAILASLTALFVVSKPRMNRMDVLVGSVWMGGGIAGMHYIGMNAMRLNATPVYHPWILAASIVLAMLMAYLGLTLLFYMRKDARGSWLKVVLALVLGLSIATMHYTGMAAVSFRMAAGAIDYRHSIEISGLANFAIIGLTMMLLGLAAITSVVDRRISMQSKVLESERAMLRTLIDHMPDFMYVKDLEGRFLLVNRELANRLGAADPEQIIGTRDADYYPHALAAKFREDEIRVMTSGEAMTEQEETGEWLSGVSTPILTTKVPLRDGQGTICGIAGVGRNIAELKQGEAALAAAEQKYRNIYNESLVGIFSLDAEGCLLQANPAMAGFLGYASPEDLYAHVSGQAWCLAVSQEAVASLREKIHTDGYAKAFEIEVVRKDGAKIWISSSTRAKYEGGVLVGYEGMFEDITERRILREQLLQAQKLESVGQLAAGIAHEINTPTQYIGDNVRFLGENFGELVELNRTYERLLAAARANAISPEVLQEAEVAVGRAKVDYLFDEIPKAIAETLEGVSRVSSLVGAMKEFSHPGTGEKVFLDLNRAIESTVAVSRNEWKYVAEMQLTLDAELPLVRCLPGAFNQVMLNLIVNASHAIADVVAAGNAQKGLISIETRGLGKNVEIRVQDSGGGIAEEIRTRIFDPFFTTKDIGKGTGQGLAIARSVVVDKHQGSIEFETECGRGTTFVIRLPCEAQEVRPQVAS